ncbi:MAG: thiolase family protein [Proteobacteria bacterium]|nr:thiolase family protein [Pseudomonadota bacterium]MBU1452718.1 thiolase family protein [Pseudomonadota bacterium]MBU2467858.1 thiolase family protein [Pseudomonadota bacterium]MBU2519407.1 thiolase family protein [Pseudomonadota bacterium]
MKNLKEMREVFVAGIGLTKWGVYEDQECYDFGSEAIFKALADAGMGWTEVQAAFCGSVYQGTASGHQAIKEVGLTGIPVVNVENACSSGGSSLRLAYLMVAAEIYDVVIALGMEKMPRGPIPSTAFRPWELASGFNIQVGNYALETVEYMKETGVTEEDLARVTVKNRKNGAMNPNARFQKPVSLEEVMGSRMVAEPLRLLHCCPLADGAAAAVLCGKDKLKSLSRGIKVAASALTSGVYGDGMPAAGIVNSLKYPPEVGILELSAQQAYEASGYGPEDIDIVQGYDTTVPSELWGMEKLGFCNKGEAAGLLRDGKFDLDGELPVNTDGGLMSRGHPLGATGLGQICELVTQLRNEAGARQVKKARVGLAHAMGAGPNSSITILTR